LGIHNCAWNADPYAEYYARFPNLAYIDMGIKSDLEKAKKYFPKARRAVMYTPMDLDNKSMNQIKDDMYRIALSYAPCDIVVADIEDGTSDYKIYGLFDIANEINSKIEKGKLFPENTNEEKVYKK